MVAGLTDTQLAVAVSSAEARFARVARRVFTAALDSLIAGATTAPVVASVVDPDDLIIALTMWREQIPGLMTEIEAVYGASINGVVVGLGTGAAAAVSVPAIVNRYGVDYLASASNRLVGFADPWWHAARKSLVQGFDRGEGIPALAARVRSTIVVGQQRARTIARTEVIGASNAGALTGALSLPTGFQPRTKTWIATGDDRTRESHAAADGQTVGLHDNFLVGGASMPRPGDGPAEEVINCRCAMSFE